MKNLAFILILTTFAACSSTPVQYWADPKGRTAEMQAEDGAHCEMEGLKAPRSRGVNQSLRVAALCLMAKGYQLKEK